MAKAFVELLMRHNQKIDPNLEKLAYDVVEVSKEVNKTENEFE